MPAAIGILAIAIGAIVVVGWLTDMRSLTSLRPGWATMKPNTALGFTLAGAALLFSTQKSPSGLRARIGAACSSAVTLLGLVTLVEHLFALDLGIDQLLIADTVTAKGAHPGRMALTTAINFVLVGSALTLRLPHFVSTAWARGTAELLAVMSMASCYVAILGYLYGVSALYSVGPYSSVAFHTAALFLLLGIGVLLEGPAGSLMRLVCSKHAGGRAARRLLPFALLAPPALGWLRLEAQRSGLFGLEFGLALLVVSLVAVFVTVILSTVASLDDADLARRQEVKFRGLLEAAPDAMVIASTDGTIVLVNRQAERLYGYRHDELIGQPVEVLVPEPLRSNHQSYRMDFMAAPRARAMGAHLDLFGRRRDGTVFPVEVSLGSLDTEEGVLVSSTIRDITERKRLQAELLEAKQVAETAGRRAERANLSKSRFLAAASHDLRQPLQSVGLLIGLLEKTATDPRSRGLIEKLDTSAHAMTDMLDTLLELNQLEAGVVTPIISDFPIGDLLSRIHGELRYHAQAKGLDLRLVKCGAVVRCDPKLLAQIVRNLISNAVKYTHRGKVLLGCRRHGDLLRISVLDTGIGIADDQLGAIFEEFHQIDNPARDRGRGLGLGLSIVQRLATLLDLEVSVRSACGRGSEFSVDVPLGQQLPARSTHVGESDIDAPAMDLLLVEDDPMVRESLKALLESYGHRVSTAGDADAALAHLATAVREPDVIISDFNLPGGKNGLVLIKEARKQLCSATPAILLTGDITLAESVVHAVADCTLLRKPAGVGELNAALLATRVE